MSDERLCETREASCLCILPDDGHGIHECLCGSEWSRSDESFEPITFPIRYVGSSGNRVIQEDNK